MLAGGPSAAIDYLSGGAYTLAELLADLQAGLFGDLLQHGETSDPIERELQRRYLELLQAQISPSSGMPINLAVEDTATLLAGGVPPVAVSDIRAAAQYNLGEPREALAGVQLSTPAGQAHVADLLREIDAVSRIRS